MQKIRIAREPAVLLSINDSSLHKFLQKYPHLNGNDQVIRKTILGSARDSIVVRNADLDVEITRLDRRDVVWWTDEEDRARKALRDRGLTEQAANTLWEDFSWKMQAVPKDARRILSIGCGGGAELFFLRLRAPHATIRAIDWGDSLAPAFRDVEGVSFSVRNLTNIDEFEERGFDVIFSNHVIEHMYAPDASLASLRKLLAPGGALVSAMPLDGQGDVAFKDAIMKIAKSRQEVGATDCFIINFGHPWKTTFSDLDQTLRAAGYVDVDFFQRQWSIPRSLPYSDSQLKKKVASAKALNGAIFRPVHNAVKALFGVSPPLFVTRLMEALERRTPFGTSRIYSDLTMETLFVARNPA
jgi:2-polyprenyl-3-methyl-5-hydroxy-6-metoxy-1,4-benzoquinol methylase